MAKWLATEKRFWGWSLVGALLAAVAVGLDAYGAHGLGDVSAARQQAFATAADYQFWHGLALLWLGSTPWHTGLHRWVLLAALSLLLGVLLFAGTIYIKVLASIASLGPLTPLGGMLLIVGWLLLGVVIVLQAAESRSV